MYVLGINAYHGDAAAALVADGQLVAAVEEERFTRIKHWAGFPALSVGHCLKAAGIGLGQLDHVAVSFDPRANFGRKLWFALKQRPDLSSLWQRARRQRKALGWRAELAQALHTTPEALRATFHAVEHHEAHVAAGFLTSGFEEAAVLSVDGMGDFVSTVLASGVGNHWRRHGVVHYPHSLGYLYNAVTSYLGFPHYGDEYKVMGLAPYGSPRFASALREVIRPTPDAFELDLSYFTHPEHGITMTWDGGAPHTDPFHSPKLVRALGPERAPGDPLDERHADIAASLQLVTEEILFHLARRLHALTRSPRLVLVGGVAMNSVATGKLLQATPFERLHVPVGAADNGTSFGAAFHVVHRQLERPRRFVLEHAYWGPEHTTAECLEATRAHAVTALELGEPELIERVVDALCAGEVVGWFQGRAEFGARALGNRSLLADPRREDMRDIINLKIKFREKFRPFAPSILEEHVAEYFEDAQPSPFMERVLPIRPERRAEIPAVTHVDGSGRLQTVSSRTNPRYHRLIRRFAERTGVPMLLNTSLNENEPIVNTPSEAIACLLRTRMDKLVLGDVLVARALD